MPQPKLLNKAWASDGLKNSIPDTRSGGMPLEGATYADGFPSITMTPIATGGKPPSGKDMNGILYELSAHIVWQNQGGRYKYDATLANAIGGYSKGCVVLNDAGDTEYISTVDRNKNNPNTNKSGWRVYSSALVNNLTTNDAEKPLTAAMGKKLADEKLGNSGDQTITDGTLTIGRANMWNKIIMPSGRGNWIFEANPAAAEAVADSIRFNFKFEEPGKKAKVLRFHAIGDAGETVAYQSWVAAKAAEAAAVKADTKRLTNEDLNSITFPGLYGQALNVHATAERNYPVQKAGSLLSLPSAYNSDTDIASHQIYIPFDADEVWRRGKRNGGNWTAWAKITVSPAELEEAVRAAAGQAVLLTGAQAVRGVKTFSDGLKTTTPAATSNDTSVATTEFVRHAVDSSVPSGAVMYFAMQAAPAGWLKADGSAVSRTQYPALFAAIGTTFGAGNGKTTFNLPDLRGEFVRGWDGGRAIDPGRAFGSAQGDAIRNITGSIDTGGQSGHQLFDEATATGALAISQRRWKAWTSDTQDGRNNPAAFDFDASRVVPTAAENRPRNIALLACIKI
ncbi:tail fiber protein [Neisseria elongata]|uniref:tail fiber protein n=1 Tax=Neisseria elongata TaxID=495 RepID=UPI001F07D333|nr:tail fiber protein [Neisseria elongata]